ncbi:MAG TPA: bifunctional UDP-N-acetylglucosamine diphosphorylase/glucosamine-1-phosphate N-acetyltransferase GlmU, partial [Polyangiaceae bacterium]|nr:bifunctional UDP-N-acetylglucosamine diphosphorylase/glucosamine-1-phosphate N-acetyltransferase GlmU [Polyangiaceae bacterium]
MADFTAVVLAAGQGTRMKSAVPKVLHRLAGRALVEFSVRAAFEAGAVRVVLVTSGHPDIDALVARTFAGQPVVLSVQNPPRGTGDAARVGLEHVETERVLVFCGDTPLVTAAELALVLGAANDADLALVSAELDDPRGYGRVLRAASGEVSEIREHRDLRSDDERRVREVNAGIYAAASETLRRALAEVRPNNAQGEYYLTDTVAIVARSGRVLAIRGPADTLVGVNDREQLRAAEETLFARIRARLGQSGVSIQGDARIDDTVLVAPDATLGPAVRLRGKSTVGAGAFIDVGVVVTDSEIGARAIVKPYSVVTQSRVGESAEIGPFAHLRPESDIEAEAHIGNFVETKKTRVRRGAKANHLAYLGDGDIGERANIGAGTIFCNYDGYQKHQTIIGEGAFVGSDSQLVAPVTIGKGAYVGTGTTVTEDVPDEA